MKIAASLVMCIAATAAAIDPPQDSGQAPTGVTTPAARKRLQVGDKAPPLSVDNWVKGDEIPEIQRGQIYLVEFWATWCAPCRKSIPHISELTKKYTSLHVLGVAGSENKDDKGDDRRLERVRSFVSDRADTMSYTVAFDGDESMAKTWLEPSGHTEIPTAFIIDGSGRIVWVGNPLKGMDEVLDRVVAGTLDAAKILRAAELRKTVNSNIIAKRFDDAFRALDELYAMDPEVNGGALVLKFTTLLSHMHADERASALGAELLAGPLKDRPAELQQILTTIVLSQGVTRRDYPLAVKYADRILELERSPTANTLEMCAKAYDGSGDRARAIATMERAVANSSGTLHDVLSDALQNWKTEPRKQEGPGK